MSSQPRNGSVESEMLCARFEEQVDRRPDEAAVTSKLGAYSYAVLDAKANQCANFVRQCGLGRGDTIGVAMEPSRDVVVAILGILKAGCAYVPIDRAWPAERCRSVLDDAGVALTITDDQTAASGLLADQRVVRLDEPSVAAMPTSRPSPIAEPCDSAYVIFTSGSTGRAKGVVVTHDNLIALFGATKALFDFRPADVWALCHSTAFDFSVWEIWGALLNGARLWVPGSDVVRSPLRMLTELANERVSVLNQTPSAFTALLDAAAEHPQLLDAVPVRYLVFGGERLDFGSLTRWFARRGDTATVVNMYGITETTVHATYYRVRPADCESTTSIVGQPLPGVEIGLLSDEGQPVPHGQIGEMYISGNTVARGYLDHPARTAERFSPDALGTQLGARMYRTGDLARLGPTGLLEFCGRCDRQVKLRGFRIELEEIESALRECLPRHRVAVVVTAPVGVPGRLVAFVEAVEALDVAAVLEQLAAKLPGYMVPGQVEQLPVFPATANGKLDYVALVQRVTAQALPAGNQSRLDVEAIVCSVLDLASVRSEDDFFEIGGDSLSAYRVVAKIRRELGRDITLEQMFERPTIADIMRSVRDSPSFERAEADTQSQPLDAESEALASWPQERIWTICQLDPQSPTFNIPIVLTVADRELAPVSRAIEELVRRHQSLRTTYAMRDGRLMQTVHADAPLVVREIDLPERAPADTRRIAMHHELLREVQRPFDLEQERPLRVLFGRVDAGSLQVGIVCHHIAIDGWSVGILARELAELYGANCAGRQPVLPDLSATYRGYSMWQRHAAASGAFRGQLDYWIDTLRDAPALLNLPTQFDRPRRYTAEGGSLTTTLSAPDCQALLRLGATEGATPFMALLAAFQAFLHRWSGADDLVTGIPVANRPPHYEAVVGCFINAVPVRTRFAWTATFRTVLRSVKQTAIGAFAHQDVPFEQIAEALGATTERGRTPLFQTMCVFQNTPGATTLEDELERAGVTVSATSFHSGTTKVDLSLSIKSVADTFVFEWEYSTSWCDPATARRLAADFGDFVSAITAAPDSKLSAIPLSLHRAVNGRRLRPSKPAAFVEFPLVTVEQSIAERFSEVARKHERGMAVIADTRSATYGELEQLSRGIASVIVQRFGPANEPILLRVADPVHQIAALLGALRAGKVAVPLDPAIGPADLRSLYKFTDAQAVLTDGGGVGPLPELGCEFLDVENCRAEGAPLPQIAAAARAYVLFTSGSTGTPKGVIRNHRNVLHFIRNYSNSLYLSPSDRLTQLAPYTFSAAMMDIFGALLNGGTLFAFDTRARGVDRLGEWMRRHAVTVFHSTPTVFRYFARTLGDEVFDSVRLVVMGGEAAVKGDWDLFRRHFREGATFVNGLGSTELNVSLQCALDHQSRPPSDNVPVGTALEGMNAWIADEGGDLVADGVVGEIVIESEFVGEGYWRQPELTNHVFRPGRTASVRQYWTGNLGKKNRLGLIEFVGRRDSEVKIRGCRVDLSAVEAAVMDDRDISAAAVVARDDNGERILVAFVVPRSEVFLARQLRSRLSRKLPSFMIPYFVAVSELPLTSTGKVNRSALPWDRYQEAAATINGPRTGLEAQVSRIFAEVLGEETIDVEAGFFDVGGHSLHAALVRGRIHDAFNVDIELRRFFENLSVAELAAAIEAATQAAGCPASDDVNDAPAE